MSHIVTVKSEIRDKTALSAACQRLKLPPPEEGTFRLFSGEATGVAVRLRDWRYPLVGNTSTGALCYDNFGGAWGDQRELELLLQMYATEKAKIEARRQGHTVTEQALTDGSIQLTINVGGEA